MEGFGKTASISRWLDMCLLKFEEIYGRNIPDSEPDYSHIIGKSVRGTVDRPLGTPHPRYPELVYPINYGYIEGIMALDGEEQDAYIFGVHEAVKGFTGKVIAVVHRFDDVEEKWVVCPENRVFSKDEIADAVRFQEQYFQTEIIL